MGIKRLAYFMVLCLFLMHNGTRGNQFSKEEELEWNKQFKLLKKPSVKTIKTKYGDIYDCVDFYKQPAFDHPLLKNHSSHPQIKPSFVPELREYTTFHQDEVSIVSMKLEGGGCPFGTVPIRRLSKDEFFEIKQFTKEYAASRSNSNSIDIPPAGTIFALAQTNSNPNEVTYHGVRCVFNIYAANVKAPQYTSGEMIIQNFADDQIQVGWTVNPRINHNDITPHLFQYLNAGDSHCFNMLCPGFVSTNPDAPVDMGFASPSIRGGKQGYITTSVYQDPNTGNWWFELGDGNGPKHILGYWPKEIFKGLGNSATYIAVGGEAYSPPELNLPPMGNGYYPIADEYKTAFCTKLALLDGNHKKINPDQIETITDDPDNYGAIDVRAYGTAGRTIFFGGPDRD